MFFFVDYLATGVYIKSMNNLSVSQSIARPDVSWTAQLHQQQGMKCPPLDSDRAKTGAKSEENIGHVGNMYNPPQTHGFDTSCAFLHRLFFSKRVLQRFKELPTTPSVPPQPSLQIPTQLQKPCPKRTQNPIRQTIYVFSTRNPIC